jgi:hypothetical protein
MYVRCHVFCNLEVAYQYMLCTAINEVPLSSIYSSHMHLYAPLFSIHITYIQALSMRAIHAVALAVQPS